MSDPEHDHSRASFEMNPPASKTLRELFLQAAEIEDAAARAVFLSRACGDDAVLRQRVEQLLAADQAAGPAQPQPTAPEQRPGECVGSVIGRYKLLQQIGEGGCGVVYVAEQEEPVRRKVALKIIKLGMDTRQVVARFEAERQALALMDHPNIAKVLEAGATDTGRPYFVMELVGGIKITDYCEQNHLTTRQRLDLFIQVCRAVQHAHQKGIIHRDIKPSNVLVATQDGVPVPKVIDFGIAKATQGKLTDQTIFTAFEQFLGTPAYMSPEQAQVGGLDVDTRSDVYSLGVLLYELLTGKTPFDAKELLAVGLEAMRKTICEKEPPTPSTRLTQERLAQRAAGSQKSEIGDHTSEIDKDLDWIVMKCLEKDRARRYETAYGLARDIERHLSNEPVVAGPPGALYRLSKFIRRNKTTVAAVTIVMGMLVVGIAVSTWEARQQSLLRQQAQAAQAREEGERKKAQKAAAKSEQVAQFLKEMLEGVGPSKALGRDTTMLKEILDKTAERVGKELTNQPEVEFELRKTLSMIYGELGLFGQMETMAQENLRLARVHFGGEHPETARALYTVGLAQEGLGNYVQAESTQREALALRRRLLGNEHPDVSESLTALGSLLGKQSERAAEAEAIHREVLEIDRKRLGYESLEMATDLSNLGDSLWKQDKLAEAETAHRQALALRQKLLGSTHPDVAGSLHNLASVLDSRRKFEEAEPLHREATDLARKYYGSQHPNLARELDNYSVALTQQGKFEEAEIVAREGLDIRRKVLRDDHPELFCSLQHLGDALVKQDSREKRAEGKRLIEEALAISQRVPGTENLDTARALNNLAPALAAEGNLVEAEAFARKALAIGRKVAGNEHYVVVSSLLNLAETLMQTEDFDKRTEGKALFHEVLRNSHSDNLSKALALHDLAYFLAAEGKPAEAEPFAREALAIRQEVLGNEHPYAVRSLRMLVVVLQMQGKLTEAESLARQAIVMARARLGKGDSSMVDALTRLVSVLQQEVKLGEAETLCQNQLSAMRARQPAEETQLAAILASLGQTLVMQGKLIEAEPLARECLRIREKQLPTDWRTFSARSLLGASLLGQTNYTDAEPLLLSGYEGMKQRKARLFFDGNLCLRQVLRDLVHLYETTDRFAQAAEWKQRLEEFERAQTNSVFPASTPKSPP